MELIHNRFDIGNGRSERGRKTLAIFRANGDIDHPDVIAEYNEIIAAVGEFKSLTLFGFISFLI